MGCAHAQSVGRRPREIKVVCHAGLTNRTSSPSKCRNLPSATAELLGYSGFSFGTTTEATRKLSKLR